MRARLGKAVRVARRVLEVPADCACGDVDGDGAVRKKVVARSHAGLELRDGVTGRPDRQPCRRIVDAGLRKSPAAEAPGIARAGPGLPSGLAWPRYRIGTPQQLAGQAVDGVDPAARATVRSAAADDDAVADHERGSGDRISFGRVADLHGADELARFLVDPVQPAVGGRRNDEIPVERDAPARLQPGIEVVLAGVVLPDDGAVLPRVELEDLAPAVDDVDEAVLDERAERQGIAKIAAAVEQPAERHAVAHHQPPDILPVDGSEPRIAAAVIGAEIHEPVLWLIGRVQQAFGSDLCGKRGRRRKKPGRRGQAESPQAARRGGVPPPWCAGRAPSTRARRRRWVGRSFPKIVQPRSGLCPARAIRNLRLRMSGGGGGRSYSSGSLNAQITPPVGTVAAGLNLSG